MNEKNDNETKKENKNTDNYEKNKEQNNEQNKTKTNNEVIFTELNINILIYKNFLIHIFLDLILIK